ncbi:hypothetical protein ACQKP8_26355 [Photobacterium alginatilyticum]|uniref:hypothetical protein n=1 Tax=Photobacterium alginatilyticum TaxID=1775171 RepID=UPI0040678722
MPAAGTDCLVIYENGQSPKKKEVRYDFPLFLVGVNKVKYVGMALPEMGDGTAALPYVQVDQYRIQPMASMSKVIQSEFKAEYPAILAREVTRAVVKAASQLYRHTTKVIKAAVTGSLDCP